jgi:hypothetical protein
MKLTPTRPITIDKADFGERWFPLLFKHPNGTLFTYTAYGHDRHFTPNFRTQSSDNGQTWYNRVDNVPRNNWAGFLKDGSMIEIDCYGVVDPFKPDTNHRWAAWSNPTLPGSSVQKSTAVYHAPGCRKFTLLEMTKASAYPTHHWWALWNQLFKREDMSASDIQLCGPDITTGLTLPDGRLYTQGYWWPSFNTGSKMAIWSYISSDKGKSWQEQGLVAFDENTQEGCNESTVALLKDGRLYTVFRTGLHLMHSWSSDLGKTWTPKTLVPVIDEPGYKPGMVWPVMTQMANGALVLVYGRHGKNIMIDPTGTGTAWQARLDLHAWELDTQTIMGVPKDLQLRGPTQLGVRYWDSGDYLGVAPISDNQLLVLYDVQSFTENWNSKPYSGIRMVKVTVNA